MISNTMSYVLGASTLGFKPTDIGGCILWLRSDLGVTKDESDLVSSWADQSGNGNYAAPGVGSSSIVVTEDQLGGFPVLTFSDESFMGFGSSIEDSEWTLFFVCSHTDTETMGCAVGADTTNFIYNTFLTPTLWMPWDEGITVPDVANYAVYTMSALVGEGNPHRAYRNGELLLTQTTINEDPPPTWSWIGKENGGMGAYLHGGLAEIIIYNSVLSDANRLLVEGYLNGRYAIY